MPRRLPGLCIFDPLVQAFQEVSLPALKLQKREMAKVSAAWLPHTGEPKESTASKAPYATGKMVSATGDPGSNVFQEAGLTR